MKKVFAFVMALALVMVGSVALADGSTPISTSGPVGVEVQYIATDVVNVTVAWSGLSTITYNWNPTAGQWDLTSSQSKQNVTFTITNKSFADKNVALNATTSSELVDVTNFSSTDAVLVLGAKNNGTPDATRSFGITPKLTLDKTTNPAATASLLDTISVAVTITDAN